MAGDELFGELPKQARQQSGAAGQAAPRLREPQRDQIELRAIDLDSLIGEDHGARVIWGYVEGLDLSELEDRIKARGESGGGGGGAAEGRGAGSEWEAAGAAARQAGAGGGRAPGAGERTGPPTPQKQHRPALAGTGRQEKKNEGPNRNRRRTQRDSAR